MSVLVFLSGVVLSIFCLIMFLLSVGVAIKFIKSIKEVVCQKTLVISTEDDEIEYYWSENKNVILKEIFKSFVVMLFMSALTYFFYHAQVAHFFEESFINHHS